MSLSVCLLPDASAERAVRRLWERLEDGGVPSLRTHTHGRHVPHLTLASLRSYRLGDVRTALGGLPQAPGTEVHFDGLGVFRRSRCWLLPALTEDLLARQQAVVSELSSLSTDLHRHYRPGAWMPHLTLAPRAHLEQLPTIGRLVFEILPLTVTFPRAALVETSTGRVHDLPHPL
jgi:2'-5' RNA ligase